MVPTTVSNALFISYIIWVEILSVIIINYQRSQTHISKIKSTCNEGSGRETWQFWNTDKKEHNFMWSFTKLQHISKHSIYNIHFLKITSVTRPALLFTHCCNHDQKLPISHNILRGISATSSLIFCSNSVILLGRLA